jgi:hypothetical protein
MTTAIGSFKKGWKEGGRHQKACKQGWNQSCKGTIVRFLTLDLLIIND